MFWKKEPEVVKMESCSKCSHYFNEGRTIKQEWEIGEHTSVWYASGISENKFCKICAPKYDIKILSSHGDRYFLNRVECNEDGIPLIGLEKPKNV